MARRIGRIDLAIALVDEGLRALSTTVRAGRPSPAAACPPDTGLTPEERTASARLMRVNRAGEIAAQALYLGQAVAARSPSTRAHLLAAAEEERDHLAWCSDRIAELGGRNSLLDPLWFVGSAGLGAAAGIAGDAASLGFIDETETQVEAHLRDHLGRLPAADARSRAVLEQMATDEMRHGAAARDAGGEPVPETVRKLMAIGGEALRLLALRI